jgi:hypothetical protein
MDRTSAREFQDYVLLFEGYLRAAARELSLTPPRNPVAQAAYRAIPLLRPLLGRNGGLGPMQGLDPTIIDSALKDGSVYPSTAASVAVDPLDRWEGGLLDSARILGRIEKERGNEIGALYRAWLSAERRRDTQPGRKLFVSKLAARTVGTDASPIPGLGPLSHDCWWTAPWEYPESAAFSQAAGEVFEMEGRGSIESYGYAENFLDRLLGARLCGHVEGLMKEPMRELMSFLIEKFGPTYTDERASVAREFGTKIAKSALGSQRLWTGEVQCLRDGLHEHLAVIKAAQNDVATASASL